MKRTTLFHVVRRLFIASSLTVCTAVSAPAGDIPITPCDATTQQCAATAPSGGNTTQEAGQTGETLQTLFDEAVLGLSPVAGLILSGAIS